LAADEAAWAADETVVGAELHLEIALARERRGDLEGAQRSLDRARSLLPESAEPAPERRIREF
jgi:hypothetical protein